jgi:hypothetical protein
MLTIKVSRDTTPCPCAISSRRFERSQFLHLQGQAVQEESVNIKCTVFRDVVRCTERKERKRERERMCDRERESVCVCVCVCACDARALFDGAIKY